MSSICGIWKRFGQPDSNALHTLMQRAMQPYGPDRHFAWRNPEGRLALGGNLLQLLPEDSSDTQPLWNGDRTACLVADVRLDNRPELVRELGLVSEATLADSAVLLAAWERWGPDCLDHILGAFAFAVWMPKRQGVVCGSRSCGGKAPVLLRARRVLRVRVHAQGTGGSAWGFSGAG